MPVRPVALILLGLGLGQTFTAPVMAAVGLAMPWIVVAAFLSMLAGLLTARVFARMAGTDARTGYYASVPGGVIVMAILAQRAGLAVAPVTLAQSIRVMVVVVTVPPLVTWLVPHGSAGAFASERPEVWLPGLALMLAGGFAAAMAARKTGFANPWMLGSCGMVILLSAFGVLPSGVPGWMVDMAQVGMGMSLGLEASGHHLGADDAAAGGADGGPGLGAVGRLRPAGRRDDPRHGAGRHAGDDDHREDDGGRRAAGAGLPPGADAAVQPVRLAALAPGGAAAAGLTRGPPTVQPVWKDSRRCSQSR
jgi:hypothetical protein